MNELAEYAYDVFVSYSSKDRAWVRGELLQRLEAAGLEVCIDFRDFEPGAPSADEMERAVLTSRKTLLILTPDYLESAWTKFETLMLQVLDPANQERRLIPLLREKCRLPLRIRYLTYVDFAEPEDWGIAWTQLLTALGAPPVQEAPEEPTRAGWCLKHPYPMPPNFTGRAAEREMLSQWLNTDRDHPLLVLRALAALARAPWAGTGCCTTWTRPAGPAWSGGAFTTSPVSTSSCRRPWPTWALTPAASARANRPTSCCACCASPASCCSWMALSGPCAPTAAWTLPTRGMK
ncbi:MAG: TIR domain-containing protein [Anaerolineae bacterium]|nr:TIR domain-containing protein [Anaerolineae bacterium]